MIQLIDNDSKTNIIKNWNADLFGGSSVRETINPKSLTENAGMLKGVPLDADNTTVVNDIATLYPDTVAERIYKEGKPLRMFKIRFTSTDDFQKAISHGICLQSQSIKCHFEQLK